MMIGTWVGWGNWGNMVVDDGGGGWVWDDR
jgi:hypothetical protein